MKSSIEKLKRDLSKTKSKQKELNQTKFPIKDELLQHLDLQGIDVKILPKLSGDFINYVGISCNNINDVISCWDFLNLFKKELALTSFSLDEFLEVLCHRNSSSVILSEIFCAPLRMILTDNLTVNRLSVALPKKMNFSLQPKILSFLSTKSQKSHENHQITTTNDETEMNLIDDDEEIGLDTLNYDNSSNCFRLIPPKLHIQLLDSLNWQSILRAIIMRLETVRQLRRTVAQLESLYTTSSVSISPGRSSSRRQSLSRRFSLNPLKQSVNESVNSNQVLHHRISMMY